MSHSKSPPDKPPLATGTREPTPHDLIFKTACRYFFDDVVELTRPELARRESSTSI